MEGYALIARLPPKMMRLAGGRDYLYFGG